jgi:hypothetical protein
MCASLSDSLSLLRDVPIVLLNLNLIETVYSQKVAAVELRMLVQKRVLRSVQNFQFFLRKDIILHIELRNLPNSAIALINSDRNFVCLDVLIKNIVDTIIGKGVQVKRSVVVKTAALFLQGWTSFFNDAIDDINYLRASPLSTVSIRLGNKTLATDRVLLKGDSIEEGTCYWNNCLELAILVLFFDLRRFP